GSCRRGASDSCNSTWNVILSDLHFRSCRVLLLALSIEGIELRFQSREICHVYMEDGKILAGNLALSKEKYRRKNNYFLQHVYMAKINPISKIRRFNIGK